MPFVTRLTFQSGDQRVLERVVGDIKERAARKGVELRGPNPEPLVEHRVPQYKLLAPDGVRASNARRTSSGEQREPGGGERSAGSRASSDERSESDGGERSEGPRSTVDERSESTGGEFEPWHYTVYTRTMSIVGYDDFARGVAGEEYPESVHVTAEVTQVKSGSR